MLEGVLNLFSEMKIPSVFATRKNSGLPNPSSCEEGAANPLAESSEQKRGPYEIPSETHPGDVEHDSAEVDPSSAADRQQPVDGTGIRHAELFSELDRGSMDQGNDDPVAADVHQHTNEIELNAPAELPGAFSLEQSYSLLTAALPEGNDEDHGVSHDDPADLTSVTNEETPIRTTDGPVALDMQFISGIRPDHDSEVTSEVRAVRDSISTDIVIALSMSCGGSVHRCKG